MSRIPPLIALAVAVAATSLLLAGCTPAGGGGKSATAAGVTMTVTELGQRDIAPGQASNLGYDKACLAEVDVKASKSVTISSSAHITAKVKRGYTLGDDPVRVKLHDGDPKSGMIGSAVWANAPAGKTYKLGYVLPCDLTAKDGAVAAIQVVDASSHSTIGAVKVPVATS